MLILKALELPFTERFQFYGGSPVHASVKVGYVPSPFTE
jgi:hypothetical protein